MSEIATVIQNATPALAAVIAGLIFTVRSQGKEIDALKKRVEKYDAMELGTKLANIEVNIEWIKRKLEEG